jgi:hypothetical protein
MPGSNAIGLLSLAQALSGRFFPARWPNLFLQAYPLISWDHLSDYGNLLI